jgi:hypothetical protein
MTYEEDYSIPEEILEQICGERQARITPVPCDVSVHTPTFKQLRSVISLLTG